MLAWYVALVAWLLLTGRRQDARALAGLVPDCLVLVRRLLADERVPRRRKLLLVGVLAYLAMPFDLVPDFIPVAGQLDDVIVVAPGAAIGAPLGWTGPAARALAGAAAVVERAVARDVRARGVRTYYGG